MKRTALYLLLALLSAWPLHAQNGTVAPASGMQIRFGQAMIPLSGPWKFHTGDDMRWADPMFDDASWGTMDLTPDGSVLVVVGDVTGKGLQAGMLVALIVEAIRSTAETSAGALAMIEALNRRLCGRGQAHATCLVLNIEADGAVALANAGHLPPYLNGKALPMEGALPLGLAAHAEFPVMHFQLAPGDTLMLMSDGIAEAQDEHGQLFGFDRVHELLRTQISAAEIATAAQNFGQQDDISVLSVTRSGVREAAMAGVG